MSKQKKLDHTRESDSDITEYEENFIPNPTHGPWVSDDQFDEYHVFDLFDPHTISQSIEEFKRCLKQRQIIPEDYEKIEQGIKTYAESSTNLTREQAILYRSILKWQPDILLEKFNSSDEAVQQLISIKYFHNYQYLDQHKIKDEDLISDKSLEKYTKCAEKITFKRLNEWVEDSVKKNGEMAWAAHFDKILIYRGLNNSKYYEHNQKKGDILSAYSGLNGDSMPYFEKTLLSSYTLSPNLAEKFMVGSPSRKSERRVVLEGHTEIIKGRLFSSFFVSPNFEPAQYEFMCLPDSKNLKIITEFENPIHTKFSIFE